MKTLYKSAAVVTVFSVLQRSLGFLYRILLSRVLGAEGLGLYQLATALFTVLPMVLSGIPVTLSREVAAYRAQGKDRAASAVTAGLVVALAFALPVSLLCVCFQGALSPLFSDGRALTVFLILLPSLVCHAVHVALKGHFWGNNRFLPCSVTELTEEIVMILTGTLLIVHVTDPLEGAMRAAVAVTVSSLASALLAVFLFFKEGGRFSSPKGEFRPLISSATPISAMRAAGSAIDSLIAFLLPLGLLSAGYTSSEALRLYGVVTGMVMPVLSAPIALIGSFALVSVPTLSG
ncbi:MAG: oligosaccharide flippase family protein, partial [Christensenellaceae bacterium]